MRSFNNELSKMTTWTIMAIFLRPEHVQNRLLEVEKHVSEAERETPHFA